MKNLTTEAIARMKMFNLKSSIIDDFTKDGTIHVSSYYINNFKKTLVRYDDTLDADDRELIERIEDEYGVKVYYIIETLTEQGKELLLLNVDSNQDFWQYERDCIGSYPHAIHVKGLESGELTFNKNERFMYYVNNGIINGHTSESLAYLYK